MTTSVTLIQPRHIYAPSEGLGHIYMPTSLLTLEARLLECGVDTNLVDNNLSPSFECEGSHFGINVIGPPYIGKALELANRIEAMHPNAKVFIGGQGVRGLSLSQFSSIFGSKVIPGNVETNLVDIFGESIPAQECVSLVQALEKLERGSLRDYMSGEFCFYLSQGCRFSCTFCAAERSRGIGVHKPVGAVAESYRNIEHVAADLEYLATQAHSLGIRTLDMYLSNLDVFQSPLKLAEFATACRQVRLRAPSVSFRMRALSTVQSFLDCHRTMPSVIRDMVDVGLERVGFGIDGATPEVWRSTRKPQRIDKCILAIETASREYGLTPETLMVFGHCGSDTEASLDASVQFVDETRLQYGSIPRPHVAKDLIPGNDGWVDPTNSGRVSYLLNEPDAFQLLDFTTLPNRLTHPSPEFRQQVSRAYLAICEFEGSITQYTLPEDPMWPKDKLAAAKEFNKGRYDI